MRALLIAVSGAVLGSILSLSIVGHAQSAKTPTAVAFVSGNRILAESMHGRAEAGRLQALQQERANDLRAKQQALEATRQELATSSAGPARVALQQKEQQQRTEFERAVQKAQVDVQTLQREINADLQEQVRVVLDDLMKTQQYQLVLNTDTSLMWSTPDGPDVRRRRQAERQAVVRQ